MLAKSEPLCLNNVFCYLYVLCIIYNPTLNTIISMEKVSLLKKDKRMESDS